MSNRHVLENTISDELPRLLSLFGIMKRYEGLSDDERWILALHLRKKNLKKIAIAFSSQTLCCSYIHP
jgi:hypothetical protein